MTRRFKLLRRRGHLLDPITSPKVAALLGAELVLLSLIESRWPLRAKTTLRLPRAARNLVISLGAALVTRILEQPLADRLAIRAVRRRTGLVSRLGLTPDAETALAVLLLDYTLYLWHVLTHRVPLLWRFHRVHHADPDLDVTTALRFHFGEMALSVPFRAAQVAIIGASPRALTIWRAALLASIQFHHANVRLPEKVDRAVSRLVMTPRLHGIHHAQDPKLRDTNWSSGLAIWDMLHGTLCGDAPQPTIGVAGLESSKDLRLSRMLALPFRPDPAPGAGSPAGRRGRRAS
jgi:sterol desaturase/sphingolipid hydroxylase (fatty acid hydroxylase superfamily)